MSAREARILLYLQSGHTNKMIARELDISESTVKADMNALLAKLKVSNRTQAAIWAAANGFRDNSGGGSSWSSVRSRPIAMREPACVEMA